MHGSNATDLLNRVRQLYPELATEDAFPLPAWFHQQRAWVEDPLNSSNAVYNYPLRLRIQGRLDRAALENALNEIARRHQVLRSVFRLVDDELVQVILPPQPLTLALADLSNLGKEAEAQAGRLALEEYSRPFDLARERPLRAVLVRLGAEDHILTLTTHHLVFDDWSLGILTRELSALYAAFTAGKPLPLPELTFHYGDFVRWLNARLQGKELESRFSFWQEELKGGSGFHHLATDRARPPRQAWRGAREAKSFPAELASALKVFSQRERISPFMAMLAAFHALLHRYSGETDIAVATCAANRPLVEVEGLMGRFGNDLIVRVDLSGSPTFRELLARVREKALTTYSYQDLPFGTLVERLEPVRDPSRNPLFQVMLILQNAPKDKWEFSGVSARWLPLDPRTAKYDLNVWLKMESGLEVALEYNTDLFAAATMKRVLDDYQVILESMLKNPEARVSDVGIQPRPTPSEPLPVAVTRVETRVPRNGLEAELVKIWESILGIEPIDVRQNFFELGGDSLQAARVFAQIEKVFKVRMPLGVLFKAPTIEELAGVIRAQNSANGWSSLVAVQPHGSRPPLFCIHDHVGEILFCRPLAAHLGPDQPLYGIQAQGLDGGPPHASIEEMAAHYIQEIRALQPEGPYFLSGYCFGGLVAFEMALRLQADGQAVAFVGLLNTPAPGSLRRKPWQQIPRFVERTGFYLRKLVSLEPGQKLTYLSKKARGLQRRVVGHTKRYAWRTFCAVAGRNPDNGAHSFLGIPELCYEAALKYKPKQVFNGRATLLVTPEAGTLYACDPKDGWSVWAGGGLDVHEVPGDLTSMFDEPAVRGLAEKIRLCLDTTPARTFRRVPLSPAYLNS